MTDDAPTAAASGSPDPGASDPGASVPGAPRSGSVGRTPGAAPPTQEPGLTWLWAALAALVLLPLFRHPLAYAHPYDWRYFQTLLEVARRSIVDYGQLPLWTPWNCGGEVLLANPQSEVAAPTFLLVLLFGTALGVKLSLFVYQAAAFDGAYRLGRHFGVRPVAAALGAVLYGANGWLAIHLSSGHSNFATAALFPWMVLCYLRALDAREWALPLGCLAAWVVGLGGTSTPAIAAVLLTTLAIVDALRPQPGRSRLLGFGVLGLAAAVGACVGALRIAPAIEFALAHPRHQGETDANTIVDLVRFGWSWQGFSPVGNKRYWFHEYGWHMAAVSAPLLVVAALGWRQLPTRRLAPVLLVGAAVAAGGALPYGPWWMLKHLPIYRDLRVPSRYSILLALGVSLIAAGALELLLRRIAGGAARRARLIALLVVAAALVDEGCYTWLRWLGVDSGAGGGNVFGFEVERSDGKPPFFQTQSEWRNMMQGIFAGQGVIGCDEEAPLQRAQSLDEGPGPQARLADGTAGLVRAIDWSPNRVSVEVVLERPATLLLNQNWNEHWVSSVGRVVRHGPKHPRDRDGGRLAVELPAGAHAVTVRYRPTSAIVGGWVTLCSLPAVAALFVRARRRRGAAAT